MGYQFRVSHFLVFCLLVWVFAWEFEWLLTHNNPSKTNRFDSTNKGHHSLFDKWSCILYAKLADDIFLLWKYQVLVMIKDCKLQKFIDIAHVVNPKFNIIEDHEVLLTKNSWIKSNRISFLPMEVESSTLPQNIV